MKVLEIFTSIEGEGRRAGQLCTFIRFDGCNLKCSYCDTAYSQEGREGKEMSVGEILVEVEKAGIRNITITGGEPLLQDDLPLLVKQLCSKGYDVNIETNGSINIEKITPYPCWITMDYKLPSSRMEYMMNFNFFDNVCQLDGRDVLKFVVGNRIDLLKAKHIISQMVEFCDELPRIYFSPVFGKIELEEIVDFLKTNKLEEVTLQVQLHKIIWDPEKRGV